VNINSVPFGVPYVDGQRIGRETPVAGHQVTVGRHRVSVYFPQQERRISRTIHIEPNETEGVTIRLSGE